MGQQHATLICKLFNLLQMSVYANLFQTLSVKPLMDLGNYLQYKLTTVGIKNAITEDIFPIISNISLFSEASAASLCALACHVKITDSR